MTSSVATLELLFPGNTQMAARMRGFEWSASALGSTDLWAENLRVAVRLCLTSRFPICLWWGSELSFLYNDAFLPWLGETKHPHALMQPGSEVWSEVWDTIQPMLASVFRTAQATWSQDTELYYNRRLPREEVYITWSYTPILHADGSTVDGIFTPCSESTEKIIGARRLETLRKLGDHACESRGIHAACEAAVKVLGENKRDIPFAAVYVVDGDAQQLNLSASMLPSGVHMLPDRVSLADEAEHSPWSLAEVVRTRRSVECARIDSRGIALPAGPWADLTETALIVPIRAAQDSLAGLMVVGVSPRRPLDDEYRAFFELIAGQIGTAIADAKAYEAERRRAEALTEIDRARTYDVRVVAYGEAAVAAALNDPPEELSAELAALNRLYELSTRLLSEMKFAALLDEVLDAAIALLSADFGTIQLYDPNTGGLMTVTRRGPVAPLPGNFNNSEQQSIGGGAFERRERVIVEDVLRAPALELYRNVSAAGYRALQATPLFGRGGQALGVISTYFLQPHAPSQRALRFLDLYARHAAEVIDRERSANALKASEERFRRYFDLGLIGMAVTTPTKGITEVNNELCRILGYERSELLRLSWAELTHPDDLAADVATFNKVVAGEIDSYSMDKRWIRKDGRIVDSIMAAQCMRRVDGSVDYFIGLVQDITERKHAEQERVHLVRRAMAAQEDERRRIAREMHDQLGERLTDFTGRITAIRAQSGDRPAVAHHLDVLERITRQLDADLDSLILALRPTALDDIGLVAALRAHVHTWSRRHGVSAQWQATGLEQERLPPECETTLYRITQEALTNIARHANASRVSVIVTRAGDWVSLIIEDDGVGFDATRLTGDEGRPWGLIGMRERATLVGGSLEIESSRAAGTTVVARIPCPRDSPGERRHA